MALVYRCEPGVMAMKNILAFGDSLTWGFIAGTWQRHPFDTRWPNVLATGLGGKARVIEESFRGLEKFIPDIRAKVDHAEAATPRTVQRYVRHVGGTSFGTKFEGLKVSMALPEQVGGFFHAGSVGIIMSGWLGAVNYGVIVCNDVDKHLTTAVAK